MIKILFATLALLVALPLAAEDELTLKDGRVLVGAYDEESGKITIPAGKGSMELPVESGLILSRRVVSRAEPAPATAKPKIAIDASAAVEIRRLLAAGKKIDADYEKAKREHEKLIFSALSDLRGQVEKQMDYSPIDVRVPAKATAQALSDALDAEEVNAWLAGRRVARDRAEYDRRYRSANRNGAYEMWYRYEKLRGLPSWVHMLMVSERGEGELWTREREVAERIAADR